MAGCVLILIKKLTQHWRGAWQVPHSSCIFHMATLLHLQKVLAVCMGGREGGRQMISIGPNNLPDKLHGQSILASSCLWLTFWLQKSCCMTICHHWQNAQEVKKQYTNRIFQEQQYRAPSMKSSTDSRCSGYSWIQRSIHLIGHQWDIDAHCLCCTGSLLQLPTSWRAFNKSRCSVLTPNQWNQNWGSRHRWVLKAPRWFNCTLKVANHYVRGALFF